MASRAVSKRYCAACGAELSLESNLRCWHAVILVAPFVVIYFKPKLLMLGLPNWGYFALQLIFLGTTFWSLQNSKRLVLSSPGSQQQT